MNHKNQVIKGLRNSIENCDMEIIELESELLLTNNVQEKELITRALNYYKSVRTQYLEELRALL